MGKVAPAPVVDTYQSQPSKPAMLSKVSPLRSRPCGFLPIHETETDGTDTRKKNGESNSEDVEGDETNEGKYNTGRWARSEKKLFLEGLRRYGKGRWKQIGKVVQTRSLVQIKSHGQKVLKKLETGEDIFAALDNEDDIKLVSKQNQYDNSAKIVHKGIQESSIEASSFVESADLNPSRTPISRFAWILPARNSLKDQDGGTSENISSSVSILPRKRKGRKKEPKAKIARTDISRSSARSHCEKATNSPPDVGSALQQDTAVAVQALSELFLSASSPAPPSHVVADQLNYSSYSDESIRQNAVSHSRVEDAEILLSLMGKDSKSNKTEIATDAAEPIQSNVPWWSYSMRRKN